MLLRDVFARPSQILGPLSVVLVALPTLPFLCRSELRGEGVARGCESILDFGPKLRAHLIDRRGALTMVLLRLRSELLNPAFVLRKRCAAGVLEIPSLAVGNAADYFSERRRGRFRRLIDLRAHPAGRLERSLLDALLSVPGLPGKLLVRLRFEVLRRSGHALVKRAHRQAQGLFEDDLQPRPRFLLEPLRRAGQGLGSGLRRTRPGRVQFLVPLWKRIGAGSVEIFT